MIEDLLKCLNSYKIGMDYKGKDFDGDRVQQYGKKKKKNMAKIYQVLETNKSSIFIFQEFFASIDKTFILGGN